MHRWKSSILFGLLLVVAAAGGGGTAQAATTRGWTGAVNSNWTTAGNWNPAGVPVNGDTVVIALEGAQITGVPLGLTLEALILGANLEISGEPLKVTSAITVTRSNIVSTLELVVVLNGEVRLSVPSQATLRLRRRGSLPGIVAVLMGGHTLTKVNDGDVEFSGDVTGAGTLAATGGQISLLYPLTFGGVVSLGPGTDGYLAKRGIDPLLCGSAPNASFVLTSANLGTGCDRSVVGALSGSGVLYVTDRVSIGTGATFEGYIAGSSSARITCCGQGAQTFRGEATAYVGSVWISPGSSLYFEGMTFPPASRFAIRGNGAFPATLGGYGTFGATTMTNAVLDLASVNGKFGLARFPQLLLAQDVEVDYEIGGPLPGTGFTQLVTTDQVDIAGARLSLDFGSYVPAPGQSLTLVKGFTTGTFRNIADDRTLAEGALFTASGMQFKISYNGGAGHDVVITRQVGAATPTPTATPTATPTPGSAKFKRFVPMVARDS